MSAPRYLVRAAVLAVATFLLVPSSSYSLIYETFQGKVVGVKDGDSLVVLRDGKQIQVRLNGVDSPENGQAFGNRAKKFTLASCYNSIVTVKEVGLDKYGRTLAEVVLPDGRLFNQEIVRAGYAWWFRRYSSDEGLRLLEEEARTAKRGLWADKNPVPPWEFRHPTASADSIGQSTSVARPATDEQNTTVYVTGSGKKFHGRSCKSLQGRGVAIPYSQALGVYGVCKICGGE